MRNRVRELRTERGWTQVDLADRVGVSRQSVIAIETGKFDPRLSLAFELAELCDLRVDVVFIPSTPARSDRKLRQGPPR